MNDIAQQVQQMMQQGATKGQVAQQLIAAVQQGQVDQESVMQIFQQLGVTEQDIAEAQQATQQPSPQQQQVMAHGGKMMFAEGGQPSPEEMAMMQQQSMQQQGAPQQGQPQQGGQDPMAQVMQMVQQMMQQGAKPMDVIVELLNQQVPPEAVAQVLVQMGMPQDQVVAAIQQVMQGQQQNGGEQMEEGVEEENEVEDDEEKGESALEEKTEIPDEGEHTMMKFGGTAKKLLKKAYGGKINIKGTTTDVYRDPMEFVKDRQTNFSNAIKFNTFSNTAQNSIDENAQSEFPSLKVGGQLNKFILQGAVTEESTATPNKTNKVLYTDPKTGTVREVTQADLDALSAKKVTTNQVPITGYNPMFQQYAQQFAQNPMWGNQYMNQVPAQGFQSPFTFPNVSVRNNNLPQNFGLVTGMAGKFENMDWRVSGAEPLTQQRGLIGRAFGRDPKVIGQRIHIDWGNNQPLTTPALPGQGKEVPAMQGQKQNEVSGPPSYSEWLKNNSNQSSPVALNPEVTGTGALSNPEFEGIGALPGTEVKIAPKTGAYGIEGKPEPFKFRAPTDINSNIDKQSLLSKDPQDLKNQNDFISSVDNETLKPALDNFKKPGFFEQRKLSKNANERDKKLASEYDAELKNNSINEANRKQEQDYYNYDQFNDSYNNPPLAPVSKPIYESIPVSQPKQIDLSIPNKSRFNLFNSKGSENMFSKETLPPYVQDQNFINELEKQRQVEDSYNLNKERNIRNKNYGEPEFSYGGPSNYDIQNALNVLKMAYGGYIPKADTGMGLNKNMDTSLYTTDKSYQDILKEKDKNKSNGFGNFIDNNWNSNNLAGQWANSLQTGTGYADTIKNTMDSSTQFLNNMSMNDPAQQLANQSSSNAPLSYNTDQGLYDQFGNQTFGAQGNQVLNPTNTGYNLNQPAIFKTGGESFMLNGKKYEMGGEVELSDQELKNLKKLGYIITKKQ